MQMSCHKNTREPLLNTYCKSCKYIYHNVNNTTQKRSVTCLVPLSALGSVQTSLQSQSRTHCQGPRGTCCTPEGPPLWAGTFKRTLTHAEHAYPDLCVAGSTSNHHALPSFAADLSCISGVTARFVKLQMGTLKKKKKKKSS